MPRRWWGVTRAALGIVVATLMIGRFAGPDVVAEDCGPPIAGATEILIPGATILLGDMHGTQEIPAFAGALVCRAMEQGEVVLGLEAPANPAYESFFRSDGGEAAKRTLLSSAFWSDPFQDGRRSVAALGLIDRVRGWRQAGRRVDFLGFDSELPGADRDAAMADTINRARNARPRAIFVLVMGNLHARKTAGSPWKPQDGYAWLGSLLPSSVISLNVRHAGGTAWFCTTPEPSDCRERALNRAPDAGSFPAIVRRDDLKGYDGVFDVGPIKASPPAINRLASAPAREVAVTFDDLPAVSVAKGDLASLKVFTERLLKVFAAHEIPVTGFVNQGKLTVVGEGLEGQNARIALLSQWLDAGLELGNHTYSHQSLNLLPIEDFEADVVRGEPVIASLLAARGKKLRYFRHPFLQVGLDLDKRRAFEEWLTRRGYAIAPVTVDNDEYIFAAIYAEALRKSDTAQAAKIASAYLDYMSSVFDFQEALSQSLFGRPVRHVLLLHANELNADHAGELFQNMRQRGYAFVTLDRALEDRAYASADRYTGRFGISWMHHWELALGKTRSPSPDPPGWVMEAYEKGRR